MNTNKIDKKEENDEIGKIAHESLFLKETFLPLRLWNAKEVQHFVQSDLYRFIHDDEQNREINVSFITDEPGLFLLFGLVQNLFENFENVDIHFPEQVIKLIERRYRGYMASSFEKKYATGVIAVQLSAYKNSGKASISVAVDFLGYVDDSFFEV